jgi:two-component system, sensor histidine kinase and response regulator
MDRLLVVDDNSKNIQVLATVLAKNGYEVEYALRGKDALEILKVEDFELILLDIMMPELDGFETCIAIKEMEGKHDIPIIFLTAKTDIESVTKGFELGGVDYITKPFNDKELLKRIQTHLELKKSREKLKEVNLWLEKQVEERTKELNITKENLEKANRELIHTDQTKNAFLSLISHEIRTPLNGISGFMYLLKKQNKIEGLEKYINPLDRSVRDLEEFATKALLLTKISTGDINEFTVQELNLRELILFAINNLSQKIDTKNIKISIENLPEDITIKGDDNFIIKSFEYVIENAVDVSQSDGEIKINVINTEVETIVEIIDFGKQFPQEIIDNMFLLSSPGIKTGVKFGISLAIVKKVVEKFGGSITIENLEKGVKFCFHFRK